MLICKFWAYKLCVCVCTVLVHSVFAHTLSMGNVLSVKNSVFPLADCGIIQILNCTSFSISLESFWKFPRNPISIKVYRGFLEEMDCLVKNRSANGVDSTVTPTVGWLFCLHDHKSINLISSIKCGCFPRLLCWSLMLHMLVGGLKLWCRETFVASAWLNGFAQHCLLWRNTSNLRNQSLKLLFSLQDFSEKAPKRAVNLNRQILTIL